MERMEVRGVWVGESGRFLGMDCERRGILGRGLYTSTIHINATGYKYLNDVFHWSIHLEDAHAALCNVMLC